MSEQKKLHYTIRTPRMIEDGTYKDFFKTYYRCSSCKGTHELTAENVQKTETEEQRIALFNEINEKVAENA